MVEFDPVWFAVIGAAGGILLWAYTNWHLRRGIQEVRADIDVKRAGTERFVKDELESLKEELRNAKPAVDIKAELAGLESRLATVQIDAAPLMAQVQAELIPAVQEKVENVKSALLGHMGFAKKSVKALAEGAVEIVGERAVQEAGFESEWQIKLAQLGMDDPWLKEHKTVALGLELIKEALRGGQNVQIASGVPGGAKQVGPGPKAPYGGI